MSVEAGGPVQGQHPACICVSVGVSCVVLLYVPPPLSTCPCLPIDPPWIVLPPWQVQGQGVCNGQRACIASGPAPPEASLSACVAAPHGPALAAVAGTTFQGGATAAALSRGRGKGFRGPGPELNLRPQPLSSAKGARLHVITIGPYLLDEHPVTDPAVPRFTRTVGPLLPGRGSGVH